MNQFLKNITGDRTIWFVALLLGLVSLIAVYGSISALAYKTHSGNTEYFLFRHGLMILTGFLLMYYAHKLPFKYYGKLSQIGIWTAVILLIITFWGGTNLNGASRWLTIPIINQSFQTSDFAKVVLVVFVARSLARNKDKLHSFREGVLPILIPIVAICGLILPANGSTAILLFGICLIMMFIGKVPFKHILTIVGIGVGGFLFLLMIASVSPGALPRLDTWKNRIATYVTGADEMTEMTEQERRDLASAQYQANEAKMAIKEGSVFPQGPSSGVARNSMPHPYSDMVYAYIISSYGSILGGIGVLFLYLILLFRSIRIASRCERSFGSYMAVGLSMLLVFQAMTNMAVATSLIPVTGQPLPLVSLGGTSTWFTCLAIGIILSVSRENNLGQTQSKPKSGNYVSA